MILYHFNLCVKQKVVKNAKFIDLLQLLIYYYGTRRVIVMTVEEMKRAFAKNLKALMEESGSTQDDIAKICGTSQQAVSEWLTGKKYPRMDKVQAILDHFNVPMVALVNDGKSKTYYLDPETAALAQELKDNPEYRALLDATRGLKAESVKEVMAFIKFQRAKEKGL